jgi:hypothetical protein
VHGLAVGLFIFAYLSAVVDGWTADHLTPPRGWRTLDFPREHPWIIIGAACGIAGTVIDLVN